jgi:hypothetical protein
MITKRDVLLTGASLAGLAHFVPGKTFLGIARAADTSPATPPNPWLADSVYPTSHFNPGATDSLRFRPGHFLLPLDQLWAAGQSVDSSTADAV